MSDALQSLQERAASTEPVAFSKEGSYEGPNTGRMILTLVPNGTSRPVPHIHFDPVGSFTPGLIGDYTVTIAQSIAQAQAKFRNNYRVAQRAAQREAR